MNKKRNNHVRANNYSPQRKTLSVDTAPRAKKTAGKPLEWLPRAVDTSRKDIKIWRSAQQAAEAEENPSNLQLQNIYTNVYQDALLTSQIENRQSKVFNVDFSLHNPDDTVNEEQTKLLIDIVPWRELHKSILDATYFEFSFGQFKWKPTVGGVNMLVWELLPRTNTVPQKGWFLPDVSDAENKILYREQKEFGVWWLEFGSTTQRGLLNKAVAHALMKSFSQSCWAELCEIYGIPPRYIKTNTQDPAMLKRSEQMMRDMGAAAWFIIDQTEEFQFAQGVNTNGDVYKNLIQLCNNELSMLVSGAIIGQDTVNGNRSKDESAQNVLWEKIMQDLVLIEDNYNNIVIPALKLLGVLSGDIKLRFDIPEDLEKLWVRVKDSMNNYDFDVDWLNEKFGLKITGVRSAVAALPAGKLQLNTTPSYGHPSKGGEYEEDDPFFV